MGLDIKERLRQIKEHYGDIAKLEDLYYKICADYALLADVMPQYIRSSQVKKRELKAKEFKSMAEFEREFELGEEFLYIKTTKYQMKAYERLIAGLKMRIESLRAGLKGNY